MSTEQLPGLQMAIALLAQIGDDDSDRAIAAVHDLADERDEWKRIASAYSTQKELSTALEQAKASGRQARNERDDLRTKYDELLVALHGIGSALGIPEGDRSPYSVTCGVLERVNRLAEIEAQEPVATAWITGGRMVNAFNHPPRSDFDPDGRWAEIGYSQQPLYARPVPAQAVPDETRAACDVLAERRRQVSAEGYDHQHDDSHVCGEIAAAACFYAMPPGAREWDTSSTGYGDTLGDAIVPDGWVLSAGSRRRDLVKAGALILAEIERMDRAAALEAALPDCHGSSLGKSWLLAAARAIETAALATGPHKMGCDYKLNAAPADHVEDLLQMVPEIGAAAVIAAIEAAEEGGAA